MKSKNIESGLYVMWKEIKHDKLALMGLFLFISIVITVYIWAFLIDEQQANRMNLFAMNQPPGNTYLLGTDPLGRDMVQQLVLAARNSLNISFIVTIGGASIGILLGLIMGYYAGHIDNIMMRIIAVWTMIPGLMLIILFRTILNVNSVYRFSWLMIIVGGWLTMTGLIRVMSLRQGRLDYVSASKTLGTPNIVIMVREVLPNLMSILTSGLTLVLASNMALETGLSFLGLGLPPGTPSLGGLLAHAGSSSVISWSACLLLSWII